MPEVSETKRHAAEPGSPAAQSQLVTGAATVKTGTVVVRKEDEEARLTKEYREAIALLDEPVGPFDTIDEVIFDGIGGFLAVEDKRRGLVKAFGGDTLVTLSNGQRYVVPKELKEANPINPAVQLERNKERGIQRRALETAEERTAREEREKKETPEQKKEREKEEERLGLKYETKEEREAREKKAAEARDKETREAREAREAREKEKNLGVEPVKK